MTGERIPDDLAEALFALDREEELLRAESAATQAMAMRSAMIAFKIQLREAIAHRRRVLSATLHRLVTGRVGLQSLALDATTVRAEGRAPAAPPVLELAVAPVPGLRPGIGDVLTAAAGSPWRWQATREQRPQPAGLDPSPPSQPSRHASEAEDPRQRLERRRREVAEVRDQIHALGFVAEAPDVPAPPAREPDEVEAEAVAAARGCDVALRQRRLGRQQDGWGQWATAWEVEADGELAAIAAWLGALAAPAAPAGFEEAELAANGARAHLRGRLLSYPG